jgi:hypothetical protein
MFLRNVGLPSNRSVLQSKRLSLSSKAKLYLYLIKHRAMKHGVREVTSKLQLNVFDCFGKGDKFSSFVVQSVLNLSVLASCFINLFERKCFLAVKLFLNLVDGQYSLAFQGPRLKKTVFPISV